MTEYFISERFRRAVVLHVIKNLAADHVGPVPLLLGIHGPSGDGKTYQCELVLRELGAQVFLISGGQLESREAGEPAQLLRRAYLEAGRAVRQGKAQVAVVLINDIDTGLGNWGDLVQYTINRQTVFGELMHFVDYPTSVEGEVTQRIPIIVTGNDFTKLYQPLVRAGRMTAFPWEPTAEERVEIASHIFVELKSEELRQVLEALDTIALQVIGRRLPISFLPHLRASLLDDALWVEIIEHGARNVISMLSRGLSLRAHFATDISADSLIKTGVILIKSGQLVNHLERVDGHNLHVSHN